MAVAETLGFHNCAGQLRDVNARIDLIGYNAPLMGREHTNRLATVNCALVKQAQELEKIAQEIEDEKWGGA